MGIIFVGDIMYMFKRQFCSDKKIATKNIQTMLGFLQKIISDEMLFYDIKLIVNELIFNGLEHGNQYDVNKKITFKIELTDEYIRICVKDEGTGINYCSNSYFNNDIYVRGRGLFIVSKLCDELKIKENSVEAKLLVKPN